MTMKFIYELIGFVILVAVVCGLLLISISIMGNYSTAKNKILKASDVEKSVIIDTAFNSVGIECPTLFDINSSKGNLGIVFELVSAESGWTDFGNIYAKNGVLVKKSNCSLLTNPDERSNTVICPSANSKTVMIKTSAKEDGSIDYDEWSLDGDMYVRGHLKINKDYCISVYKDSQAK